MRTHEYSNVDSIAVDQLAVIGKHLLGVAEGLPPPANESIVDVDLTALPALPPDHHGYERRLEIRTSILAKNKATNIRIRS